MKPDREALRAQKREYEEKAHSLKSYVRELTGTAERCGADHALFEEDLIKARNDAQLFEEEAARLDETLAGEYDEITYLVREDSAGEWRWTLRAANNRTIADSGEGYRHRQDCLHAIELVKQSMNAPVKEVK
jgi:uncharacterized protein YegP (UPF0339 family)